MRVSLPLPALAATARAAGALSRLAGTGRRARRCRASSSGSSTRRGLAARGAAAAGLGGALRDEREDDDCRDDRRDPAAGRCGSRTTPQGANLVSGVASTLLAADHAELGLFEVDEAALPQVAELVRPRVLALGNLFRDQLDRYGELELIAERWRGLVRALPADAPLVVNGDDPQLGDLVARAAATPSSSGSTTGATHAPAGCSTRPTRSTACAAARRTSSTRRTSGTSASTSARSAATGGRRSTLSAREIELDGLESTSFELARRTSSRRVTLRLPGLYNVYNALAAAALSRALGASLDEVVSGLERFGAAFGRFERIEMDGRRLLMLLIKNPAGANEAMRTLVAGGAPSLAVVALNDAIADGKDVSWIWDVDFEPLLDWLERVIVTGDRAAELALRFKYAGFDPDAIEVVPSLERGLDRGLELTPEGGELVVLPTYTAMLELRRIVS